MNQGWHYIKIRKSQGRHTDVYVDFEAALGDLPQWMAIHESSKWKQRFFNKYRLPKLQEAQLKTSGSFNTEHPYLFATISGTQYSKIESEFSKQARHKAIYMFDPWPPLNTLNENAFRSFGINTAIFPAKQAVAHFNACKLPNFKAFWVPEGINSDQYQFVSQEQKDIDVLQYGRHWTWLHRELIDLKKERNLNYQYDKDLGSKGLQFLTRKEFTETLSRTKIAVCVPRNITHPELVGELSTLTTRYFECMSSKCLIWGHAPQELIELFGYNPVIEIDATDPKGQLVSLLKNFNDHSELIERNYTTVRLHHQWKQRAEQIQSILNQQLNPA